MAKKRTARFPNGLNHRLMQTRAENEHSFFSQQTKYVKANVVHSPRKKRIPILFLPYPSLSRGTYASSQILLFHLRSKERKGLKTKNLSLTIRSWDALEFREEEEEPRKKTKKSEEQQKAASGLRSMPLSFSTFFDTDMNPLFFVLPQSGMLLSCALAPQRVHTDALTWVPINGNKRIEWMISV